MVDYINSIFGVTGAIWTVIQVLIAVTIVGTIVGVVVMILRYNIKVRIREVIGGKTRIIDERARPIKDAEGVLKWKLLRRKHCIPVPPPEAIHLTSRGKYSVEAYYLPEGEYKFVMDNGCDETKLTNFEPLDTADREFYASEMREAEQYKKKSWKEFILPIASLLTIFGVLVVMLVFWEDIAKPGITISNTAAGAAEDQRKTAEMQKDITQMLRDIIQDRQGITVMEIPNNNTG